MKFTVGCNFDDVGISELWTYDIGFCLRRANCSPLYFKFLDFDPYFSLSLMWFVNDFVKRINIILNLEKKLETHMELNAPDITIRTFKNAKKQKQIKQPFSLISRTEMFLFFFFSVMFRCLLLFFWHFRSTAGLDPFSFVVYSFYSSIPKLK